MARPVVLTFVHYYLPGYKSGGPIRTISHLVEHLGGELDFRIVTADRDATDEAPYPSVRVDAWNTVGQAQVFYASPAARRAGALARLAAATPHDLLYVNSFFDAELTVPAMFGRATGRFPRRPLIIAPRGEFAPASLASKRWKKAPYLAVFRALRLGRGATWQASSEFEAEDVRRVIGPPEGALRIAPNLPPAGTAARTERPPRDPSRPLRLVFLSRIAPIKNLDFALRALRRVSVPVDFEIYGPMRDPAFWARCEELVRALPPHVRARYHGPVENEHVPRVMAEHDLFLLPTRGENYGHVIREALTAGTPVLIADTTPWRGLEAAGAGWDLPLDDEAPFAARIEEFARLTPAQRALAGERARAYVGERMAAPALVEANRALFAAALATGPRGVSRSITAPSGPRRPDGAEPADKR